MDANDILKSYLCDKGAVDLADRNPLDVLKELLRSENSGIHSSRVEECSHMGVEVLPLSEVTISNLNHFGRVKPRDLSSPSGQTPITGVIIRSPYGDYLADGYHRLKYSLERGLRSGTFVVISTTEI